jgi:HD-GYP domain-containing protein (c-di-GMP phosphodiesterase class II)
MAIDSYANPDAEALLLVGEERLAREQRRRRERITHGVRASAFLVAAALLAALAPWERSLSVPVLALTLVVWVGVERVKFPVASGWTRPTMLAFVPTLFVLPAPIVPLVATLAILLGQAPDLVRRKISPSMIPAFIGDAWFTLGPALVIVLGGAQRFAWSHWPVYVGALAAHVLFDVGAWLGGSWFAERTNALVQAPLLAWTYAVDAALAPLGLAIAAVAVDRPGLVLLSLSPLVMLSMFAREREERLDQTVALNTAFRGTALLLGDVVDAVDPYTGIHSREVVDLSLAVADTLGINGSSRRDLEFAALLHDVGKIRVPKQILHKQGSLDASEWDVIRRHTIEGERMLKQVGGTLSSVGRIVRSSHERFDGSGYPDGLDGEQIPIESRIVAACDAFNAMTTTRPYRAALPESAALTELGRCAGTQFDPRVVGALVSAVHLRHPEPLIAARRGEPQAGAEQLRDEVGVGG